MREGVASSAAAILRVSVVRGVSMRVCVSERLEP
jgi:hypothetical protein